MATAEELLSTSYEPHFYISEDLRTISIPIGQYVIGVYSDENVRRIWFDMPSTCDGTDLSDFEITINYRNAIGDVGRYYVTDAIVDNSTITFSWLVSRSVCVSEGTVLFNICLRLFDIDNETILKEFNTTLAEMRVLRGLEANLEITTPQQDAVNSIVGPAVEAATAANEAKVRANEAAAEALSAAEDVTEALSILDSITERAEAAIEAIGDISEQAVPLMSVDVRGGATLGSGLKVDGGALSIGDVVTDETDGPIYSADAEGWSEQGTTTGKNLKKPTVRTATASGVTYSVAEDGKITLSGTATQADNFTIYLSQTFDAGTYTASLHGSDKAVFANDSSVRTVTDPTVSSFYIRVKDGTTYNESFYVQLESGSTATSYEPYTGGKPSPSPDYPQEVKVARGRNLLQANEIELGSLDVKGALVSAVNRLRTSDFIDVIGGSAYTVSGQSNTDKTIQGVISYYTANDRNTQRLVEASWATLPATFAAPAAAKYATVLLRNSDDTNITVDDVSNIQLELGSTPTPYVPYGHVGLEVRDSSDELVSVTPIPLPAKGFAAALPDGTADSLAIDSAGRYEWESVSGLVDMGTLSWSYNTTLLVFPASIPDLKNVKTSDVGNIICSNYSAASYNVATGLEAEQVVATRALSVGGGVVVRDVSHTDASQFRDAVNGALLYYQLATPTTEHGYIDLPTIPEGAVIDIPELREVGVKCFVPGVSELIDHANNWGESLQGEREPNCRARSGYSELGHSRGRNEQ